MTWLFYPLIGPPIGSIMVILIIADIWSYSPSVFVYSYIIGGIQALFVGICAGAYGAWRGNVPICAPAIGAAIPPVVLILFNLEKIFSRDPLGDPFWFTLGLMFGIHLLPAVIVWSVIRIVWGQGSPWTTESA